MHAVQDDGQVIPVELDLAFDDRRELLQHVAFVIDHALDDAGPVDIATVAERRRVHRKLERRELDVALPDRRVDRITDRPTF